ncbi:AGR217Cp [Eremothecium gossypii ATCC 10895]|uniref:AGR217Cp n=1 Tax=Eremothecium gossypii (strain ATCC 10895 / CBS 109.51 / FGSC 9923 / NRRL Y-1056) TaxID=284811 RepID=Q74ZI5_EREGS|nr:AGR217Cp [Eremothecium gossypii ATCC 10895]AAS54707.2 AGR217Cp [Eremothecium gossypii ATCC 10895]AEY99037.1 FAGR217Cp [Eremothecium gossypii FDAG1]
MTASVQDIVVPTAGDSAGGRDGRPNQAVTLPVALDSATGEVLVRKATGKTRVRKGQTEEQYCEQLQQYFERDGGPECTDEGWLDRAAPAAAARTKQERQRLAAVYQRLYFLGRRRDAAAVARQLLQTYAGAGAPPQLARELAELEHVIAADPAEP